MFIGSCRIIFHLPENNSLKGKRQIVRKLTERTRAKFNVSVAEVGANDTHRTAIIACSVVGNSASHVDSMISNIATFLEGMGVAVPISKETEVINMCGEFSESDYTNALDDSDMYDFNFESE